MSKVENYTSFAENVARDDTHGYDQRDRNGNPNYDCSGLVCDAVERAGIKVKEAGASYTGNMLSAFKKAGFKDITSQVTLSTGAGLKRGDVLLSVGHHTAIYCGGGKMVDARINEKGTTTGGKSGGQTLVMVTHSVKAASSAKRVLFIKDGKVFHQLYRGNLTNEEMYERISDTLKILTTGGEEDE